MYLVLIPSIVHGSLDSTVKRQTLIAGIHQIAHRLREVNTGFHEHLLDLGLIVSQLSSRRLP